MDYMFKWVDTIPSKINDNKVVVKFFKENIFFALQNPSSHN